MTTTTKTAAPPQRLTKQEAADYLGVTARFIRDRIEDGTLPYFKLGRLVRIDVADLDAYLDATRRRA